MGLLSKLGSQGLLARMVERRALLAGLHASESRMARMVAGGAAHLIESGVQAVPSSLAGALADRETVRDGPWAVLRSTAASTAHSMAIGAAVSSVHHVLGGRIAAVDKRFEISERIAEYAAERFAPASRLDTPAGRLTAFRDWRALQRPGGSMAEFRGLLSEGLAAQSRQADEAHALARAARRELLAGLPPAERGQYAGIPVVAVPAAEFARLPGDPGRAARLVTRDGQAVVALREGAPVTAAAAVLPEMRSRVLPGTGGLTVSAALPPSLRDVPAFVDPALPGDEIQVVPTDGADGRVAGVELRVAPGADPVQIALHAGEIRRWQGWVGALGRAREALAGVARLAGAEPVTPGRRGTVHGEAERARFEAAGEARKLDPLIQERLRQYAGAADAPAAGRLRAQVAHMVAQLERARRIATGEVIAQPRGYVAMSDTLAKNARPPAEVSAALRELRERERVLSQQIADHEFRMDPDLVVTLDRRKELRGLLELFGDHPVVERLRTLDPQGPAFGETLREFALPPDPIQQGRNRISYEERRDTLRRQATGKHVKPAKRLRVNRTDLLGAYVDFLIADRRLRPHREALSSLHPQRDAVRAGISEIYGAAGVQYHADVLVSPLLRENIPLGGWRDEPRPLLRKGSAENRMSHRLGEETEIRFANVLVEGGTDIGTGQIWHLVKWGAPPGELGKKADIIAAPDIGLPVLADTKYRASGQVLGVSETFSKRLDSARTEAMELLRDRAVPGLTLAARDQALANLKDWRFSTWTVYSDEIGVFHYAVEQVFTGPGPPMVLVHPTIDWRLP